jgi:O-antigen/teichoic acid export membrane protein
LRRADLSGSNGLAARKAFDYGSKNPSPSMFRKSALNFASQALNFVVSFGDRIVLVGLLIRSWGADAYADWATLLATAAMFSLAELGFQIPYGNRLSMAFARGDMVAHGRTLATGIFFYISLVALLASMLAVTLVFVDVAQLLRLRHLDEEQAALVFGILGIFSIFHVGRAALSQIYRGRGEFHRGIIVDSAISGLTIGVAVVAASAGTGPFGLSLVYLAAEFVGWGAMGLDITRRYPGIYLRPQLPTRAELKDLTRTLSLYAPVQALPIAWLNAPILVVSLLALGGSGLVSFVVQRSLVNFGRTLSYMLSIAVGIELATLALANAPAQLARGVEVLARLNATLAGLLAAGLVSFGPVIIVIWTGRADLASLPTLIALVLPAIVTAASAPLSMLCMYANRPGVLAISLGIQFALGVPAAMLGGMNFGVLGVAVGIALGEIAGSAIALPLLATRAFNISYGPLVLKCLAISSLAFLWGLSTGWLIVRFISDGGVTWLAAALATWGLTGAAPPLFLALPQSARARLRAIGRK